VRPATVVALVVLLALILGAATFQFLVQFR
jgi:hypothetical protein